MWTNITFSQTHSLHSEAYRISDGRFFPLAFYDLDLLARLSASPYFILFFNALEAMMTLAFLGLAAYLATQDFGRMLAGVAVFFSVLFMITSYGFVTVYLGIAYPERFVALFFAIFATCLLALLRTKPRGIKRALLIILGGVSIFLATFYKEVVSVSEIAFVLGSLGLCALYLYRQHTRLGAIDFSSEKERVKRGLRLAMPLFIIALISGALFLVIYAIYILPYRDSSYVGIALSLRDGALRLVVNYALENTIVALTLPALFLYRLYSLLVRGDDLQVAIDGLALFGTIYLASYIALGFAIYYYLVPIYALALPSMAYYVLLYWRGLFVRAILVASLALYLVSSLPASLLGAYVNKAEATSNNKAIGVLARFIKGHKGTVLYFAGQNSKNSKGYVSKYYEELLALRYGLIKGVDYIRLGGYDEGAKIGAGSKNIKFHSTSICLNEFLEGKATLFRDEKGILNSAPTLMVLTHASSFDITRPCLRMLDKRYKVLYRFGLDVPFLTLKSYLKHLYAKHFLKSHKASELHYVYKNPYLLPSGARIYEIKR